MNLRRTPSPPRLNPVPPPNHHQTCNCTPFHPAISRNFPNNAMSVSTTTRTDHKMADARTNLLLAGSAVPPSSGGALPRRGWRLAHARGSRRSRRPRRSRENRETPRRDAALTDTGHVSRSSSEEGERGSGKGLSCGS